LFITQTITIHVDVDVAASARTRAQFVGVVRARVSTRRHISCWRCARFNEGVSVARPIAVRIGVPRGRIGAIVIAYIRIRIVIARLSVGATRYFVGIANAVIVCVRSAGAIAFAQCIQRSNAIVHIVTDAVTIGICCARTTADTQRIKLVAVAIAITSGDARSAANSADVKRLA